MIVEDLVALADAADDRADSAPEVLSTSIEVVMDSCQRLLGHMVRVSEMVEVNMTGPGDDADLAISELAEAGYLAARVQIALCKAVRALHGANRSATAAVQLDYLRQTTEGQPPCDFT